MQQRFIIERFFASLKSGDVGAATCLVAEDAELVGIRPVCKDSARLEALSPEMETV